MEDAAIQVAETIQTAHIQRSPSIDHDVNPSTAASLKEPVVLDAGPDEASFVDSGDIPASVLRPAPRRPQMPPIPDLRFEQSYLASIKNATDWKSVAYITIRDQILFPLIQGMAWSLMILGWHHLNRESQFSGQSMGAKVRRWWWGVNNWAVPAKLRHG
ncbi:DUF1770-domain-containing protein [Piedraia hortae CBS 480.64]|uniref:DUF1770-domain-containing protein n=1 Tax=Piedraia hortae CBS 480.64 TaxID=1314780 RepID=A0A6A7C239_9PEZI|nr:DUF1770-domain-containing protein [Piedraia hortae CBS 480.64]